MKFSHLAFAALPALATAHNIHVAAREHVQHARQNSFIVSTTAGAPPLSSVPAPSGSAPATVPVSSAPASGAPASSGASTPAPSTLPSVSFSLLATNPTAVPLSEIVSGASSSPTVPLDTTVTAGTQPTNMPGAPPIPNAALLVPSNYPPLDKPPPTDSPEVLQWIQDVANSGITIPNITATVAGGCPANPAAVADSSRCWWTCSGCTAPTDITTCPTKMTWGLTYDDGPAFYTPNLLDYLDSKNLKSTFFVVGSRVISNPATLQSEYISGHHIAVHTWSHPSLTTLSNEEIIAELGWSKKVIKDVLGVTPNMMRPPYGDIDNRVRAISAAMGLTPVIWTRVSTQVTFDTGDFNIAGGTTSVSQVLQNWENILGNASQISTGFIVLEHDLFQQSVEVATGYILPDALAHNPGYNITPVISCLNMPMTNAYIETNNNKTNPPPSGSGVSGTGGPQATGSGSSSGSSSKPGSKPSNAFPVMDVPSLLTGIGGIVAGVGALFL